MVNANIISIGSELTKGEIDNTNAAYISGELTKRGIDVTSIIAIPDSYETALCFIDRLLDDDAVYIFTGGLGGTEDDTTRRIVSGVLKKKLVTDMERVHLLEKWYASRGRDFGESDRIQAACPEGGRLLENRVGLAYGFYLKDGGRYIISLPGVPKEMKVMFDQEVLPILEREHLFSLSYRSEILSFSNISEYVLDKKISGIVSTFDGIEYGTRAKSGIINVLLESQNVSLKSCVRKIERTFRNYLISSCGRRLEEAVGDYLRAASLTLSTAESCTAGLLSKLITDIPGSSEYYIGGIVCYSNEVKRGIIGVSDNILKTHGAVSKEAATGMVLGVLDKLKTDIGVAITGIAGPDGGSKEKPVGTVYIAVCRKGGHPSVGRYLLPGDRETIRVLTANTALFKLFEYLRNNYGDEK